jgi:hypothetical protein
MKRGRDKIISILFVLLFIMTLIPFISAGFFSDLWGKVTGHDVKSLGVNVTVSSMNIIYVNATTLTAANTLNLNSGPYPSGIMINFTIYNGAGVSQVNDSTVNVTLYSWILGEVNRTNLTCYRTDDVTTYYANYSCNVTMWWYDTNGTWNITVSVLDNNSNRAINTSATFVIAALTGFQMYPVNLTWPIMTAGAINQTSNNDPLALNNTGNQQIGIAGYGTNLTVNATHLAGETDSTKRIFANNFTVASAGNTGACSGATGNCIECDTTSEATQMLYGAYKNVSNSNLSKGNFTVNNNYTGQEQLFFCLRAIDTAISAQAYSTLANGSWVVKI